MRILLVTPMPPRAEAPGAIPVVLHAQVTGLRRRNEITLVTVVGDEPGELEATLELQRSGLDVHWVDRRRPRGVMRWRRRWRLARGWVRGPYPWRTLWFAEPALQQTVDWLIRTREFDVVAVEDNSMGVFHFPQRLPSVLTEHEVRRPRPIDWGCGSPSNWPRWAFQEADWRRWPEYQRAIWGRFERIQVFAERDAAAVGEIAPDLSDRVRVTPFGVDLGDSVRPGREEPGRIVFVGNFTHLPNVDAARWLVHDIMPLLRSQHDRVQLTLVGGGTSKEIHRLKAEDIDIAGEVPDVAPYLESAEVVLAPVRIGGGMRMKVLQALASGKAVVTTSRGAEGLTLGGAEPPFLIRDDAPGIARATANLLQDARLREELAARARVLVAKYYSVDAFARRLEKVYDELIAEWQGRAGLRQRHEAVRRPRRPIR